MTAKYPNGKIPLTELIVFKRGVYYDNRGNVTGSWYHALTPGTYAKHLKMMALAKARTGRSLRPGDGASCYRDLAEQARARAIYGNGAAVVGTSSHGGYWEGMNTLAIDYSNWAYVYGNGDGNDTPDKRRDFYADQRAAGLEPGMISPARGYPDEPWHSIDKEPYRAVPADAGGSKPFPGGGTEITTPDESEEDIMRGAVYNRASDKTNVFLLFSEVSGFYSEHSGTDGTYNNALATSWETNAWPTITEGHANALKKNLDKVAANNAASTQAVADAVKAVADAIAKLNVGGGASPAPVPSNFVFNGEISPKA